MTTNIAAAGVGEIVGPKRVRPDYELKNEPDGRAWIDRENLVDIIERELLGPLNGRDEILDAAPDVVYLLGRIAPVRLTDDDGVPRNAEDDDQPTDVGGDDEAHEGRGVPITDVDDSSASTDEDEEDEPQKRGLMIPASMGLRFQFPDSVSSFDVTASWGEYHAIGKDGEDTTKSRRYQRTPVEITTSVPVAAVRPGETKSYPLKEDIVLRIDRYDDAQGRRLIEVALCNDRETPRRIPVDAWLYQTKLTISAGGDAAFVPVNDCIEDTRRERNDELRRLNLQYRDRLQFAVGRTCSVDWTLADGVRRATEVSTTWLPITETPQTAAEEVEGALLDMVELAAAGPEEIEAGLSPIVGGYADWLDQQESAARDLPEHLLGEAEDAVTEARKVHKQLAAGLKHVLSDPDASACFRFMNRVMADQRIQTQVAELRAKNPTITIGDARAKVLAGKGASAHSWRTFQLAFILMQLLLLTDPSAEYRSGDLAKAELLFFPTGGGKTEAYLGLAAYSFAIRRRQGIIQTADGPLDGGSGVTVLMRYTLRLLTAQQFQRATALVCAAELTRAEDPQTWGDEPFRIGLWVGTDVSPKRFEEAEEQLKNANGGRAYRLTVLQVQRCPWCGTRITAAHVRGDKARRRIHVYCGDELAECPFSEGGTVGEGLPVLTVDEEIYRLAPAFVIATVDKFARLAREGEAASLFGYVSKRCDRHGYVHADYRPCELKDGSKHPAKGALPAASVHPVGRLRPPDMKMTPATGLASVSAGCG